MNSVRGLGNHEAVKEAFESEVHEHKRVTKLTSKCSKRWSSAAAHSASIASGCHAQSEKKFCAISIHSRANDRKGKGTSGESDQQKAAERCLAGFRGDARWHCGKV